MGGIADNPPFVHTSDKTADKHLQINRSCRICLSDLISGICIFSEEGKRQYLHAKIRKYLYITVCTCTGLNIFILVNAFSLAQISLEDKLPKIICDACCKKLDSIHKFASMASKNQTEFLNHPDINDALETKQYENKGLLHTYLTQV